MRLLIPKGDTTELQNLAPNYGYFGASDWNSLEIDVGRKIDWICFQNASDESEYLNLERLILIARDEDVSEKLLPSMTCSQSSWTQGDTRKPSDLLRAMGVHTNREVAASWEATFQHPVHIDQLIIRNRSDYWGIRSRNLRVLLGAGKDIWIVHDPLAISNFGWLLSLMRAAGSHAGEPKADLRLRLLAEATKAVLAVSDIKANPVTKYLQLIDQAETEPTLKIANITLLATVIARYHAAGFGLETKDLHQFEQLLSEKQDIVCLETEANIALTAFSDDILTVSRHFITASRLLTEKTLYCSLIQEVLEAARETDNQVCLGYGTLLGCVRDHGFIRHDDDVDLIIQVPPAAKSGPSVRDALMKNLAARGFKISKFVGYEHHKLEKNNAFVELFPAYTSDGKAELYMQDMKARKIPADILFPTKEATLYGQPVVVPAQPEAFLSERYGSTWRKSDRFYEWRWELTGEEPVVTELPDSDAALMDFNEIRYLKLHPDVASAVNKGLFVSGRSHFKKFGWREGRTM